MNRVGMAALVLGAAMAAAVGALSRVPVPLGDPALGHVRLSWRMPGEVVEVCRERTREELEGLPAHMRTPEVCEGRGTPWLLALAVDGEERLWSVVEPGGARGDGPVVVLEEVPVEAGTHRLEVRVAPTVPAASSEPMSWQGAVDLSGGEVLLLTLDAEARDLVAIGSGR